MSTTGVNELGRVESVSSEICTASGLASVALNNLVQFSSGEQGIVFGFTKEEAQIVIIGDNHQVKKGDLVRITQEQLQIKVGPELLGRIIDPLGNPLDEKGPIEISTYRALEVPAKPINHRDYVSIPLSTGFLIIDANIPIGLGQRELLLGDKKIGKGDVGAAMIVNQARIQSDLICVYVTVDIQTAAAKRRIAQLQEFNAIDRTVVVVGRASDAASLNYIAPMSGMTIAEHFASQNRNVLIIFDNLTRHAKVYRQISLLLGRSPGREAFPGDLFYLHARLLERAGKFQAGAGGGSITAIPLVEIQNDEVTDYVTTNLMSITDGHIMFRESLANKGVWPPVDSGYSVSRIGGRAQFPAIRPLAEQLKLFMVHYHEVEKFTTFGTELQEDTLQTIERGQRVYKFYNQRANELLSPLEELFLLEFILGGHINRWDLDQMEALRRQIIQYCQQPEVYQQLVSILVSPNSEAVKQGLTTLINGFTTLPTTLKPTEKKQQAAGEKETVIDLLRTFSEEENNA